ncbi:MAG TPA: YceI family protein [Xanthomonadaceae bacterium]|jgi:polyisoprenoid-binding protein YceI
MNIQLAEITLMDIVSTNTLRNVFTLALLASPAAMAGTWHADGQGSTLAFSGVSQGEAFSGKFKTFDATIVFDTAKLAGSRFDVKITLASADTANAERDDSLHGKDFFDAAHNPVATYTATKFRSLGGNRYAADGTLSLHGVSKPVTLTFTWTSGVVLNLTGDAVVNRLDFNVGGGQWADTTQIANAVKVHTSLILKAASK